MKLTPELLAQAPSSLNTLKQRELDLRGYKIPAIENLGVTRDQHDCIDLTDNSITALANLPLLRRLNALLLANNRIASISPSIHLSVPNMHTLVLTNNAIGELGDLEPLRALPNLRHLSLLGNPVRERKWYREWIAWRLPHVRVLDFQRIRDKERKAGDTLFKTTDDRLNALGTQLSTTVSSASKSALSASNADEPRAASGPGKAGRLMSKDEADRVRAAIAAATSIEEIRRLERQLKDGFVPGGEVGA
ncbi:L domain-like protein [Peniophora sp. CONT]|nr:L domain-like protein [Peniophora sp. CONT]